MSRMEQDKRKNIASAASTNDNAAIKAIEKEYKKKEEVLQ